MPRSSIDLSAGKQFRRIFLSRLFRERAAVVMDEVYCRGQRIGLRSIPHKDIAVAAGQAGLFEEIITRLVYPRLMVVSVDFLNPRRARPVDAYMQHCFFNFTAHYSATEHKIDNRRP